jgi:hypothetical protein
MLGDALMLGLKPVCPHARDCNQQKERDKLIRWYKRDHSVSSKALRKNLPRPATRE